MKAYVITFIAAMFAWWIIRQQDDPDIFSNALYALGAVAGFIIICLGVFELCACAM